MRDTGIDSSGTNWCVSYVAGFDDSLEEVQDSQPEEILMEECESVMEVECGEGEEDGVETQAEVKLGGIGISPRVNLYEVSSSPPPPPLPCLFPPSLTLPPQEAPSVEVPNSQDAVTLIPADMDSQVQVESLGEEEKKVRAERERGWKGREWSTGRVGSKSLVNKLIS